MLLGNSGENKAYALLYKKFSVILFYSFIKSQALNALCLPGFSFIEYCFDEME